MQLDFHNLFLLIRKFQVNTKVMEKKFNDTYHVIHCTVLIVCLTKAAVHAARQYLHSDMLLLKLDFSNAINSILCGKMLLALKKLVLKLYPLVHSAYSSPSSLFWGDKIITDISRRCTACCTPSADISKQRQGPEDLPAGRSSGPCLCLHNLISELTSELKLGYLDDLTLGGSLNDISHDAKHFELAAEQLGLKLNHACKD